jgi:hypothetical protein
MGSGIVAALFGIAANASLANAQDAPRSMDDLREIFDRGCGDDNGVDRCDSVMQERMRELYDIEAPEALLPEGTTIRRAMFVDGYGNDVAAITFAYPAGASPYVEVRSPDARGTNALAPLQANIGADRWAEVLGATSDFDQQLARETEEDGSLSLCLHAWFVVAESSDAARVRTNVIAGTGSNAEARSPREPVEVQMTEGVVRRDAESSCAGGLATKAAFDMARLAHESLPECGTLDPEQFRTLANLLAYCHRLGGDRLTAGEAEKSLRGLARAGWDDGPGEIARFFVGIDMTRANLFREAIGEGMLYIDAPIGHSPDRVSASGKAIYHTETAKFAEAAEITLNLVRQSGGFKVDTFEVSDRRPFNPGE